MSFWRKNNNQSRRQSNESDSRNLFRQGSTLNSGRLQQIATRDQQQIETQKRGRNRLIIYRLIGICLLVILLIYLFATRITSVSITDANGKKLPNEITKSYQSDIYGDLNHNLFNGFQPFVPVAEISKQLVASHPEISTINIHNNGFSKTLSVQLSFKSPVIIWQTKTGNQFYLSDDGAAFQTNYSNVNPDTLVHVVDTSGLSAESGKVVASTQTIDFVVNLHHVLSNAKISVVQYSIPATLREIDLQLSGQPYVVKLLSTNDVGQEVAELQQSLEFFSQHPDQVPRQYLDLRVVGRAFYQ